MGRITQEAQHHQRMMKYWQRHTLEEMAIRYRTGRKAVVSWWERWDEKVGSLEDKSRKPYRTRGGHSEKELRTIRRVTKKHRWPGELLGY